jgi:hypothetical protein
VRPPAASRQKLHPDGSVPENSSTPTGADSMNVTATGRFENFTAAAIFCSNSLPFQFEAAPLMIFLLAR